jgi:hypothetical protein
MYATHLLSLLSLSLSYVLHFIGEPGQQGLMNCPLFSIDTRLNDLHLQGICNKTGIDPKIKLCKLVAVAQILAVGIHVRSE